MSSFLAPTRTRVRIAHAVQRRAGLSLVPGRTQAPRVPFAALVLTVLALGLVGLLVLNTSLQQGAFYARDLEERAQVLSERREALQLNVDRLREPQRVAQSAAGLGMVPNQSPAFLRLSDGKVLGHGSPATIGSATQFLPPPRAAATANGSSGTNTAAGSAHPGQGSGR